MLTESQAPVCPRLQMKAPYGSSDPVPKQLRERVYAEIGILLAREVEWQLLGGIQPFNPEREHYRRQLIPRIWYMRELWPPQPLLATPGYRGFRPRSTRYQLAPARLIQDFQDDLFDKILPFRSNDRTSDAMGGVAVPYRERVQVRFYVTRGLWQMVRRCDFRRPAYRGLVARRGP